VSGASGSASPSLFVGYHGQPELSASVLARRVVRYRGSRIPRRRGALLRFPGEGPGRDRGAKSMRPTTSRAAISEVPGVRSGCVAAFGWLSEKLGTEAVVAVVETQRDRRARPQATARRDRRPGETSARTQHPASVPGASRRRREDHEREDRSRRDPRAAYVRQIETQSVLKDRVRFG